MDKRAQHVIFGTMLMLFIFFFIFALLLDDIFINPKIAEERYQLIRHEAIRAGNTLTLPGYPEDWDKNTVQRAGLITNNTYDPQKAQMLKEIAQDDYGASKDLIGVRHDYLINITTDPATIIGSPSIQSAKALADSNPRYVAAQARTAIDKSTGRPVTITTYVYRHTP